MARICVLVTSVQWGDCRQLHRQVPALVQDEHEVIYIAAGPQDVAGPFKYCRLSPGRRRIARLTGGLSLFVSILRMRPDALQVCNVVQLPLGLAIKSFTGIKMVYDCREDMASAVLKHRYHMPRWLRRPGSYLTRLLEYLADVSFDGLIVSDPALYELHRASKPERKIIFYNTPLLSRFTRDYPPLSERKYDVVLMGSMSQRSGVVTVVDAIGMLKRRGRPVTLLLLGEPDKWVVDTVNKLIKRYGIEDLVTITGWTTFEKVPHILPEAKIGVTAQLDMPKFRRNIACKAFEYMACGMPCICSDLPPQRLFVRQAETGLFYQPGNAQELADTIASVLDNLPRAQAMGEAGRRDVEREWHCEREQAKLRQFYRNMLERN